MRNPPSPYANQVIDALITAADALDPVLVNEFFSLAIDANLEHLNLIDNTLTITDLIHRQRIISQGTTLLSLFNHFATRKIQNGLSELSIPPA